MYRTHNCGELNIKNLTAKVQLSGWVHKIRNKGFIIWVDLRDRYGSTQLIFDQDRTSESLIKKANTLGREFVISIKGSVIERKSKNPNISTGEIEILVSELNILNKSLTPPFTIEDESDGESKITFTISGFPNRLVAGLYAADLLAMRDISMHEEIGEYLRDEKETLH